jgi:hypothetical protein
VAKHTLHIEDDYDFLLIGIASHVKDYRICWAINEALSIDLTKVESLEIKDKKQTTPSYFSFFKFDDQETFREYAVISNISESKAAKTTANSLFANDLETTDSMQKDFLIPELKNFNYLMVVKGELTEAQENDIISKLKSINLVVALLPIETSTLKSKHNLIF